MIATLISRSSSSRKWRRSTNRKRNGRRRWQRVHCLSLANISVASHTMCFDWPRSVCGRCTRLQLRGLLISGGESAYGPVTPRHARALPLPLEPYHHLLAYPLPRTLRVMASTVHDCSDHPLVASKLSKLRLELTSNKEFREVCPLRAV